MNHLYRLYICFLINIIFLFTTIVSHAENNIPSISAESGIVYCINTKQVLYEKNIHDRHFPASITKVLTSLIAIEHLKFEDIITYSDIAVNSIEPNSSHLWIVPGELVSVKHSLYGLLMKSANEMANGLAEQTSGSIPEFVKLMNEKTKELGCNDSNFVTTNGLHDVNHYTSAYDMAVIAAEAFKSETFREIIGTKIYTIPATNKNVERVIANSHKMLLNTQFHRDYVLGGKTGYTDQAGHTLITFAEKDGMQLVAVGLKSDRPNSYLDTIKMLDYSFQNFKLLNLVEDKQPVKQIPIYEWGKQVNTISALSTAKVSYVVPMTYTENTLKADYDLPSKLEDSIVSGQNLGTVKYSFNNEVVSSTKLVADKNIKVSKSIFDTDIAKTIFKIIFSTISFIFYLFLILLLLFIILIAIAKITHFKIKVNRPRPRT